MFGLKQNIQYRIPFSNWMDMSGESRDYVFLGSTISFLVLAIDRLESNAID